MNFGNAGSLNDINILDKSSIATSIWRGDFDLKVPEYKINNVLLDFMYFWWMVYTPLGVYL
jgi:Plant transposon protein